MKYLAIVVYIVILCGSFMLGMYVRFNDAKEAVNNKKYE